MMHPVSSTQTRRDQNIIKEKGEIEETGRLKSRYVAAGIVVSSDKRKAVGFAT
jgi:hypothetical protein